MNLRTLGTICVAATLAAMGGAARAGTEFIVLGQSAQDYVLYGQGAYSPGLGSFTNQQGSESASGGSVTDTLTGSIVGATNPLYGSGTYSFVTTYTGTGIASGGTEIQSQSNPAPNQDEFYYSYFDPSVDMTLTLDTAWDGTVTIPLVTNGVFDGPNFSFTSSNDTCSGAPVAPLSCGQNNVGLTPGAAYSGPVTILVSYAGVPEPAAWAMMLLGVGLVGAGLRLARGRDETALTTG